MSAMWFPTEREKGKRMERLRLFMIVGLLSAVGFALALSPSVAMADVEICNNKVDDDKDGAIDCQDTDCVETEFCKEPPPPPKADADCSPGYYKNHVDTWDDGICFDGDARVAGTESNVIYRMLCAECGATRPQRVAAKALLDFCFETAERSPCEDDD